MTALSTTTAPAARWFRTARTIIAALSGIGAWLVVFGQIATANAQFDEQLADKAYITAPTAAALTIVATGMLLLLAALVIASRLPVRTSGGLTLRGALWCVWTGVALCPASNLFGYYFTSDWMAGGIIALLITAAFAIGVLFIILGVVLGMIATARILRARGEQDDVAAVPAAAPGVADELPTPAAPRERPPRATLLAIAAAVVGVLIGLGGFVLVYAADAQLIATTFADPDAMAAQATLGVSIFGIGWVTVLISLLVLRRRRRPQIASRLLWASVWMWWAALIPGCLGGTANTLWGGMAGVATYGILVAVPALALLIVGFGSAIRARSGKSVRSARWPLCWTIGISIVLYVVLAGVFFQV